MISASPIAGCPSFKFLTMPMQPSASCTRMWTVLSATIMFADKPHRLNERTSAQRFFVLTILPPVTALAVGLPAQRAIAQRFRALALFGRNRRVGECLLLREERKSGLRGPISVFDPGCVKTCTSQECAELFSLSSSLRSGRKHFWFQIYEIETEF